MINNFRLNSWTLRRNGARVHADSQVWKKTESSASSALPLCHFLLRCPIELWHSLVVVASCNLPATGWNIHHLLVPWWESHRMWEAFPAFAGFIGVYAVRHGQWDQWDLRFLFATTQTYDWQVWWKQASDVSDTVLSISCQSFHTNWLCLCLCSAK